MDTHARSFQIRSGARFRFPYASSFHSVNGSWILVFLASLVDWNTSGIDCLIVSYLVVDWSLEFTVSFRLMIVDQAVSG